MDRYSHMTTTYTNITLVDVEPDEAAAWLAENGHTAAISPSVDDLTVVYENTLADHAEDDEPLEALLTVASEISYELGCMAWLVIVDEDAVLIYTLYSDGEAVDSYGVRVGDKPDGGDPDFLAARFERPKKAIKEIRRILNRQLDGTSETASARLEKLLTVLDLPTIAVGYDYARLQAGETPSHFTAEDLLWVSADDDKDSDDENEADV
jgi:hypothetical protein